MKKLVAFLTVLTLSLVLVVSASATDKILQAHKAKGAKVKGKDLTCATCHNATKDGIAKKKGLGLAKGEANYAKTKANGVCKQCHK